MRALRRLAASHGVQWSYRGVDGALVEAEPEAVAAVLRALGAPVAGPDDAEDALRARRDELAARVLPPCIVLWQDAPSRVPLRLPVDRGGVLRCEIGVEGGATPLAFERRVDELEAVPSRGPRPRRLLPLSELPLGHHRLSVELGDALWTAHLLHAPRRAFRSDGDARTWGLFAPLYALPSRKGGMVGDVADLEDLLDLVAESGGGFAQTLPLYAAFPEEPSPYSPSSRLFWNELYLDPTRTSEWRRSDAVRRLAPRVPAVLRDLPHVDPAAAHRLRRPLLDELRKIAERERPGELARFRAANEHASDYARFRATVESGANPWEESALLPVHDVRARFHVYVQLAMEEQLEALARSGAAQGVGLYQDLPLGVHGGGYDVWRFRTAFARGADVGAPPDAVFTDGQRWGFPPLVPSTSRETGHEYLRLVLAKAMRHASMLRIDHVMGLHRQYWIPAGFEKRQGVYVRYPAEELYAVAILASHRERTEIVGENLGIVPPVVDRSLEEHGLRGLYVLQYSLTGRVEEPVRSVPEKVVASLGTHDTPPFAGFCSFADVRWREERRLDDRETARRARDERERRIAALDRSLGVAGADPAARQLRWIRFLLDGPAEKVAVTLEDLWQEDSPQNIPGTTADVHPNWRRKLRHPLWDLPDEVRRLLRSFRRGG